MADVRRMETRISGRHPRVARYWREPFDPSNLNALNDHGRDEADILDRYRRLLDDDSHAAAVRYLVSFILDDEARHHRVLEELANAIVWGGLRAGPDNAVPELSARFTCDDVLQSETRALLNHELQDRTRLRKLRKSLGQYGDVALWDLLIDIMQSDTEKHIRILRFILDHGRNRRFHRMFHRR